jgi:hypothetical protein
MRRTALTEARSLSSVTVYIHVTERQENAAIFCIPARVPAGAACIDIAVPDAAFCVARYSEQLQSSVLRSRPGLWIEQLRDRKCHPAISIACENR